MPSELATVLANKCKVKLFCVTECKEERMGTLICFSLEIRHHDPMTKWSKNLITGCLWDVYFITVDISGGQSST
jgi:hypothetical protein